MGGGFGPAVLFCVCFFLVFFFVVVVVVCVCFVVIMFRIFFLHDSACVSLFGAVSWVLTAIET